MPRKKKTDETSVNEIDSVMEDSVVSQENGDDVKVNELFEEKLKSLLKAI